MPLHPNLERLIGAALVNLEFRDRLLTGPVQAAAEFDLSADELKMLASARAATLDELAAHVWAWSTRAGTAGRSIAESWVPEVREAAPMAV